MSAIYFLDKMDSFYLANWLLTILGIPSESQFLIDFVNMPRPDKICSIIMDTIVRLYLDQ